MKLLLAFKKNTGLMLYLVFIIILMVICNDLNNFFWIKLIDSLKILFMKIFIRFNSAVLKIFLIK